ncbi:P-loop containing nucleoside triphosphate hydrolase protein [Fomitiporia mediterranea MF3/22]|uniref:P-loop containing nucleoside triphosphate hydrolase protein n=1 Tax=Fomitiporia mediterranea (strain MF3/22) TaxID=694068 RepID=UPI000440745C|nr:P-loop containing nucleoside triphosphate hydrolase protein [Fomitiporia mediterranea MF3/22]EJD07453.1 P-loop containing nucleoside triphosphate hydrolase protein [Fomitiporia mediterranea MF3/22]
MSVQQLSLKAKLFLNAFNHANAATFLAAAHTPESIPKLHGLPEVIVTGRANVGKSSFLNAVIGRTSLVHSSKGAGRTRSLNFFRVGREPGTLVLVDAPGYGSRGKAEWGALWEHYIDTRKQLRGIFLLINAPHRMTEFDRTMLKDLNARLSIGSTSSSHPGPKRIPVLQPVFTKIDRLGGHEVGHRHRRLLEEVKEIAPIAAPPILSSVVSNLGMDIGVSAARMAIANACAGK